MTEAAKSKHQAHPWQPTTDSSNDDQKKAGEAYTAIYGTGPATPVGDNTKPPAATGNIPGLTTAYTVAPDLVPTEDSSSGSGSAVPMRLGAFSIDLGALRTAEQSCLNATTQSVHAYENIRQVVTNAIGSPSLFGQRVGTVDTDFTVGGKSGDESLVGPTDKITWDKLDQNGKDFAATMNPQLHNLLVSAAGVIELMGGFTAMLNNAGQMYTQTDNSSAFAQTVGDA